MRLSIAEFRERLEEAVAAAEAGEPVEIVREGRVVATLAGEPEVAEPHPLLGAMRGEIWIANDFDELGPEWDPYVKPDE